MEVFVRVDASFDTGLGHFMRCFSLVQAMRRFVSIDEGRLRIVFLCAQLPSQMEGPLNGAGIELKRLQLDPEQIGQESDFEETLKFVNGPIAPLVVLDSYEFDSRFQKILRQNGCRVFVFDDDCSLDEYDGDFVLNQTFASKKLIDSYKSKQKNPDTRFLLGPNFILLRDEFQSFVGRSRLVSSKLTRVLLTVGGSDMTNVLQKSYDALLSLGQSLSLSIITGSTNCNTITRDFESEKQNEVQVSLIKSTNEISAFMDWADLAICGGGATTWEMAFMGTPFMAVHHNEAEQANVEELVNLGLGSNLGRDIELSPNKIKEHFLMWSEDQNKRANVAKAGPKIVDGLGGKRILNEIKGRVQA